MDLSTRQFELIHRKVLADFLNNKLITQPANFISFWNLIEEEKGKENNE